MKEALTNSYRKAVTEYFDKNKMVPDMDMTKLSAAEQEEALYQMIVQYASEKVGLIEKWSGTPLDELQGKTPAEIIEGMADLDEVFEVFRHMACFADEELPILLIYKMQQFGQEAVTRLYRLTLDSRDGATPAEYLFSAAVSSLGIIKLDECVERLIELAYQVNKDPQLEQIEEALKRQGGRVIEPLIARLTDAGLGKVEQMLLYVLAYTGSEAKDERIYRMLRNAFRTLEDKMPAVVCLSVYGDGRAVPMLRSFLERYADDIPDRTFHEIIGTIRNLGGETEDFMQHHHHHH